MVAIQSHWYTHKMVNYYGLLWVTIVFTLKDSSSANKSGILLKNFNISIYFIASVFHELRIFQESSSGGFWKTSICIPARHFATIKLVSKTSKVAYFCNQLSFLKIKEEFCLFLHLFIIYAWITMMVVLGEGKIVSLPIMWETWG